MKKLILALAFAFAVSCTTPRDAVASSPEPVKMEVSSVFVDQVELILDMQKAFPLVKVQIFHEKCGEENAYYWSREDAEAKGWVSPRIILCSEMDKYPSAALMFAAHEMGHAITDYYTSTSDEQAADEIGALAMLAFGHQKALLEAADYYLLDAEQRHVDGDGHPSNGFRHWFLRCMATGATGHGDAMCVDVFRGTYVKWFMRLNDEIITEDEIELDADDLMQILLDPFKH
jgi:hypothetical protein